MHLFLYIPCNDEFFLTESIKERQSHTERARATKRERGALARARESERARERGGALAEREQRHTGRSLVALAEINLRAITHCCNLIGWLRILSWLFDLACFFLSSFSSLI